MITLMKKIIIKIKMNKLISKIYKKSNKLNTRLRRKII
jgi:hypothetical protein